MDRRGHHGKPQHDLHDAIDHRLPSLDYLGIDARWGNPRRLWQGRELQAEQGFKIRVHCVGTGLIGLGDELQQQEKPSFCCPLRVIFLGTAITPDGLLRLGHQAVDMRS